MKLRIARKIYKRYSEWLCLFRGAFGESNAVTLAAMSTCSRQQSVRKAKRIVERKAKA